MQLLSKGAKEVKQEIVLVVLAQQDGMSEEDLAKGMKPRENRVRSVLSRLKTKEQ